jgi:nitrate/TMAO reductase-like tetraheme cytochrome c subunit
MDFGGFMIHKAIKKTLLIVLSAGLIVVVVLWGVMEYTSRPSFCTSCHYMEPYYQAWQTSTHRDVTCTDCHFLPGVENKIKGKFTAISMVANYMTGIYRRSKPWAEIENASCLRTGCHVKEALYGTIQFKEKVKFDHEPHLSKLCRGKKLRCTSCHSQIIQGEHISVSSSTCFLCHFKPSKTTAPINRCTQCHEAPIPTEDRPTVKYDHTLVNEKAIDCQKCHGNMQVGDGAVPKERCSSCHAEAEKIERYSDVNAIHKYHVTEHKVECQTCHLMIQHKSITRTVDIKPDCNNCHESEHVEQLTLFLGKSLHSEINVPNPMFNAGLNCKACHIFHKYEGSVSGLSQSTVANGESCEKCHGTGYAKLFDRWEEIMQQKVDAIGEQVQVVKKC